MRVRNDMVNTMIFWNLGGAVLTGGKDMGFGRQ